MKHEIYLIGRIEMKYNCDHKYTMDFESEESLNSQLVNQGYILVKDG